MKRRGGDTRTLGLYGQELIHITAAIARMNLVLHGVEDFDIARGNTLPQPGLHRGRPAAHLRRGARQSAVLDQEVEPRGVAERPLGPQLPRHAAAGPRRLRLLPAHPEEPRPEDRPLRDPLPARRALPQRRGRDAAQARRGRPASSACSASARTSSTTRRWRPASSSAARGSPQSAQGQDPVHRRCARGRARAGAELPDSPSTRSASSRPIRRSPTSPASPRSRRSTEVLAKDGNLSIPRYVRPVGHGDGDGGQRRPRRRLGPRSTPSGREFWQQMDALVGHARRRRRRGGGRCLSMAPGTAGRASRSATWFD